MCINKNCLSQAHTIISKTSTALVNCDVTCLKEGFFAIICHIFLDNAPNQVLLVGSISWVHYPKENYLNRHRRHRGHHRKTRTNLKVAKVSLEVGQVRKEFLWRSKTTKYKLFYKKNNREILKLKISALPILILWLLQLWLNMRISVDRVFESNPCDNF